ncbi:Fe-S cluster assembly sulfur transfer protein SufU [Acidisphaera sp. L21]|uniref:Fe-S cluster assembly sulfur transfer protein SufU n=1 Tax=Acidisphaera sp. L21 TaxID=1641851 RepID=UPI00131E7DCA|nr:SUF system NifU family Fe-S cluster assembly protein [Acidisphaera sp. L21]
MSQAASFDDMRDLYQEVIMARGRHPQHQLRLDPYDGAAKGDNPMCGDRVEVRIRMAGDTIAEAGFEARGCAISVASADLMADAITGRTPTEVRTLAERFRVMVHTGACPDCGPEMDPLRPLVGVHEFKSRLKCATLPWDAMLGALKESGHG